MEYKFNIINLYYKNIFLKKIKFEKNYSIEELKKNFEENNIIDYYISIQFVGRENLILKCNLLESYFFEYHLFEVNLKTSLSRDNWKIIKYIAVVEFIANSSFVYKAINFSSKTFAFSFASLIAKRNLEIVKILFRELIYNNQLICNFLLRDIIENIKLYLYFIRGAIKEETITNQSGTSTKEIVNDEINEEIIKTLSQESKNWNYDIKKILKENPSLKLWEKDLHEIEKINNHCNSNIHKLGITKILPNQIKDSQKTITISDVCYCIRFFITLIICYDGKEISSSDYTDYLDFGMTPLEGSQYWIAPIIQDFINSEYDANEKNNLIEMSCMNIE